MHPQEPSSPQYFKPALSSAPHTLQATLAESDGREAAAGAKLAEGQQAMQAMLAQAAPVADVVIRALQECQAWQVGGASFLLFCSASTWYPGRHALPC